MKNVLITGGTGFVSRYAANYYVEKGCRVYTLNRNTKVQPEGTTLIQADRHAPGDVLRQYHFDLVLDVTATDIVLDEKPDRHIFNVGNKEAVSVLDWVTMCYQITGRKPEFIRVTEGIEQREYFSFYDYEYYLDVQEQERLLPVTKPLQEGLAESLEWYLAHPDKVRKKPLMQFIDANLKSSALSDGKQG